jgi:putative membrane protein
MLRAHDPPNEVSTMQLPTTLAELPVAQWQPGPHGPGPGPHGPHWGGGPMGPMGPGPGTGAVGLGFGGWWVLFLLALLVVGVVAAALYLQSRDADADAGDEGTGEDGALAVLRERYAAGDVDDEEFERRRDRLTG